MLVLLVFRSSFYFSMYLKFNRALFPLIRHYKKINDTCYLQAATECRVICRCIVESAPLIKGDIYGCQTRLYLYNMVSYFHTPSAVATVHSVKLVFPSLPINYTQTPYQLLYPSNSPSFIGSNHLSIVNS